MTQEIQDTKNLITQAKTIYLVLVEDAQESVASALALFYTLKELNKNVNLIIENFPEKFNFLVPSLDFISSPKNFVISIPRSLADVSQVYYEKNEENLKIHLTIDKGNIKKDNISFYFSAARPDLVITLGIKDFESQLAGQLDSFGFILDSPIVNIDNSAENKKFGKVNIIQDCSLAEITLDIITSLDENAVKKNTADCLLAGLILHYQNFKSPKTNSRVFEIAAQLIKSGASNQHIINSLYEKTDQETKFLGRIFQDIKNHTNQQTSFATLDSHEFQNMTEPQVALAVEKIKSFGIQNNVLVLWPSHASPAVVKGFFYSKKQELLQKIANVQQQQVKNDWVSILIPGNDIQGAKNEILNLIA